MVMMVLLMVIVHAVFDFDERVGRNGHRDVVLLVAFCTFCIR